jgi:hypothetical protein
MEMLYNTIYTKLCKKKLLLILFNFKLLTLLFIIRKVYQLAYEWELTWWWLCNSQNKNAQKNDVKLL